MARSATWIVTYPSAVDQQGIILLCRYIAAVLRKSHVLHPCDLAGGYQSHASRVHNTLDSPHWTPLDMRWTFVGRKSVDMLVRLEGLHKRRLDEPEPCHARMRKVRPTPAVPSFFPFSPFCPATWSFSCVTMYSVLFSS